MYAMIRAKGIAPFEKHSPCHPVAAGFAQWQTRPESITHGASTCRRFDPCNDIEEAIGEADEQWVPPVRNEHEM
jgi:hypothetical protein